MYPSLFPSYLNVHPSGVLLANCLDSPSSSVLSKKGRSVISGDASYNQHTIFDAPDKSLLTAYL